MAITLNGTTGITTPDITSTTSTLGSLTQALDLGSTGQIVFPATQNASANGNTLDDYEEGTFTPTNNGGMTGFSAIDGTYIKIGRLVQVRGSFSITGVTTNMVMGGLPFASMNQAFHSVVDQNIPVSLAYRRVDNGATTIQWNVNATGSFSVTIHFTAWYFTA